MNPTLKIIAGIALGTALTACGVAEAEPMTYGSDATLDALQDDCGDGDLDACETLFWESPVDSDYEAFAMRRVESSPVEDALVEVWATMADAERDELCQETEELGLARSHEIFAEGYGGGDETFEAFATFVDAHC